MKEQVQQSLQVLLAVINAATANGVFKTAQEATIANQALQTVAQVLQTELSEPEANETSKKGPKKVK